MLPDILNISVLYGAGVPAPDFLKVLEDIPQVQMVGQAQEPEEILEKKSGPVADLVMVYMDGDDALPEWLENLTSGLPQTAVLLCSHKIDPEYLLKAMRQGIREVIPLPLNQEELEAALNRVRNARRRMSDPNDAGGRVMVITGNKGGVGATTVAVNLSVALARSQMERVLLVDLGRPYPDVGNFLDRDSMYTVFDLIQNQENLDQAFLEKTIQPYEKNLALIHGVSDFNDQESINLEGLRKIFPILKAHYRWVVVDLSHWLDELFLQVVHDADLVMMIVELTVPDLRNLGHLWPLLRNWMKVQEKVKLVVNRYDRGYGLNTGNMEQVLKQKAYYTLPSDYKNVSEAINRGVPLVDVAAKSRLSTSLEGLAQQLQGQLKPGDKAQEAKSRFKFWG